MKIEKTKQKMERQRQKMREKSRGKDGVMNDGNRILINNGRRQKDKSKTTTKKS